MGSLYLVQIKATPTYNLDSTYNRIMDMGKGISESMLKLKSSYTNFYNKLSPIELKAVQLMAIKETLEAKQSLSFIQKQVKSDFEFLPSIQNQIAKGVSLSTIQINLIEKNFVSLNNKLKEINLQEALKEQIDTTSKLRVAFRELSFNKIEFKQVKKSSTTIIRAKKADNTTVSVKLNPNGMLELDLSNVPKERCKIEMNKILEKFKEHGLVLEVQKVFNHESLTGSNTTKEVEKFFDPFDIASNFELTDFNFESDEETTPMEQSRINQLNFNKQRR